ncbi:MAG: SDR family oxidoreductase [Saprospiraceae bacterium]|nr:SDR family oxidoreductase [Saprospiraceae bacterium]
MNFENKNIIVTGGGSGIGKATSLLFGQLGGHVIVSDINIENAKTVCEEIINEGGKATYMRADVSKYEEVQNLIKSTCDQFGSLDIIVANAGIGNKVLAKTADHTLEDWDKVISVNQTGVFYCMKVALNVMMKQGFGNIVNVASLAGLKASGNNIAYSASKFAVVGMTKSAALEYASKNIRINAVCPGYTKSALLDMLLDAKPELNQKLEKMIPMKRFGKPNEIAQMITWLASDYASFVTGQCIGIDGGLSL